MTILTFSVKVFVPSENLSLYGVLFALYQVPGIKMEIPKPGCV
jgi:hypothetical protein